MNGDVEAVLQVAAAAAATSGATAMGWGKAFSCDSASSSKVNDPFGGFPRGMHSSKVMPHLNHDGSISFRPRKEPKKNESDKFASRTEAEADAAAAALLAELDKEKEEQEASKTKKSKKKKKKERQAAKEKEKEDKSKKEVEQNSSKDANELQSQAVKSDEQLLSRDINDTYSPDDISIEQDEEFEKEVKSLSSVIARGEEENDESLLVEFMETDTRSKEMDKSNRNLPNHDDIEGRLARFITANDVDAIESILAELKGIPGRAALRKNAKKALKKIKEESTNSKVVDIEQELSGADEGPRDAPSETYDTQVLEYKSSEPLLKLVSSNHRAQTAPGVLPRAECVMHMAPGVVGWVIGKGGQRIRDVMEESGAKVWIDQDSMGPQDMRIVYVSGSKKSVDAAVRNIKDLVAKAPVGGTTVAPGSVPAMVNDSGSVTSTRSSLTSTPVSFAPSVTQQAPVAAQKPSTSPSKKTAVKAQKTINSGKNNRRENAISMPTLSARSLSMPPPGMENVTRSTSPMLNTQTGNSLRGKTPPKVVRELFCEPRFVPLLIGRRGWTVKNIQDTSGARVDIDQKVIPRKITISGGESQVNDAVKQVQEVLSYPHAQQNYSTSRNRDNDGNERVEEMPQTDLDNPVLSQMAPFSYGILPNTRFLNDDPMIPQPLEQPSTLPFSQPRFPSDYATVPNQSFVQNPGMSNTPSSAFLNRQSSAPLPLRTAEMQFNATPIREVESNMVGTPEAFDSHFLRGSFSHEESQPNEMRYNPILPLSGQSQIPFMNGERGSPPMTNADLAGRDSLFSVRQDTHSEHDLLSNLFGHRMPSQPHPSSGADSLLQGFGNLSFGEGGSTDFGLGGANWDWDGLVGDEKSSSRSFGLGGVRLDTSSEIPDNNNNNNNNNCNTNRNNMSQWGM
jgi:hypothetical protein